jgi:GNAT superfamily N-acetyltransferase
VSLWTKKRARPILGKEISFEEGLVRQMTRAVSIRRATLHDIEMLVDLRLMLLQDMGHLTEMLAELRPATHEYLLEALPAETFLVWVAEASGQIVATSGLIFFHKPPSERNLSGIEAYILNMYTLPEWRGQGIATALLDTMMAFIKQTKAHRVWLYATQDGRPLYEKTGFVPTSRHTLEMDLFW